MQRFARDGRAAGFAALVGLAGWGLLLLATYRAGFGPESVARPDALAFAMFLCVIVAARALAFPLMPGTVVALDAGFFVAAAVCLGTVTAGRLVALALSVDALTLGWRLEGRGPRPSDLPYALFLGGMTGALLMVVGWVFNLDSLYVLGGVPDGVVLYKVLAVGGTFLVAHYALQGARLVLGGRPLGAFLRGMAVPGILAEAALLPLAAIIVFIYHPDQPLKFGLLGTTYLVINFAVGRIAQTRADLKQRVAELETLNRISHRLAAQLATPELCETVARELLAAVPEADALTLSQREGDELVVDVFPQGGAPSRVRDRLGQGVVGEVMATDRPIAVVDLEAAPRAARLPARAVRSWLGVPLDMYGQPEGVLALERRAVGGFAADRLRLLEAVGAQLAVALENARLYELAMVDGLTGLFVRRYFDSRIEQEIERSRRFATQFSLVMMDLDDFKLLNDTHGHVVGDRFLRAVADIVRRQMRAVDTAARYGGEEFAVVLPGTSLVDAHNQAERIRQEIAELALAVDGEVVRATASFGIAAYPESGADGAEAMVRLADRALYRAKRTGKNRVELYWSEQDGGERSSLRIV